MTSSETTRPTEPKRPEQSLGELVKEMTGELTDIFRQEIELAKVETREEVQRSAKAGAAMGAGGVAALLCITFLSTALALLLDQALNTALSFVIVAVLWGIAAGALIVMGRNKMRAVQPLPHTTASIKEDMEWAKNLRS